MKKAFFGSRLAALATTALVGLSCAVPAHAEITAYAGNDLIPSIQVYVRIDAGLRVVTNVDNALYNGKTGKSTLVQGAGNDWGTSMFGITGALPLTTDTKAVYKLESGFNATNGETNGTGLFNRRAYVGLSDDRYGTILFGKDLFIDNDIWGYDPMVQENMSTATLVYGRNWPQVADMVEYRSPETYALKLGLQASFDKSDQVPSKNYPYGPSTHLTDAYGASLQYTLGNLNLLGIYDVMKSNAGYTNLYGASKEAIFGATYNFNPVEVFAGYEMLRAPQGDGPNATSISNGDQNTLSIYATKADMSWLGAVWTVTPKVTIRGAWYYTTVNDSVGHANLVTVGTEYYFRPNMFWYATVGEVLNHGETNFSADIGSPAPGYGKNQFSGYSGLSIAF